MALVTIEGVVKSDVSGVGERHTVEHTDYIRGLLRNGLVKVVEWHHEEPSEPVTESAASEPETKARRSRRRSES
ncbi:hypothetical protein [Nocardia wallacei]|uniref:hypothetical protein n=1 Tax=Nocardia wallacei TaxID=480035 RepID=UPI002455AD2C|nr:hypothetical protein [Nocardia wallacei]